MLGATAPGVPRRRIEQRATTTGVSRRWIEQRREPRRARQLDPERSDGQPRVGTENLVVHTASVGRAGRTTHRASSPSGASTPFSARSHRSGAPVSTVSRVLLRLRGPRQARARPHPTPRSAHPVDAAVRMLCCGPQYRLRIDCACCFFNTPFALGASTPRFCFRRGGLR